MKKVLSSALLLASVTVSAGENYFSNEWDAKGLIAIEATMNSTEFIASEGSSSGVNGSLQARDSDVGFGLKLGGESRFYRAFLVAEYYNNDAPDMDYTGGTLKVDKTTAVSLGLQMDYLIRAGEHFNIFMGLNGGGIYSKYNFNGTGSEVRDVKAQDGYAGVQAGVNIDIIENLGIELGARYKYVFTDSDALYAIDNMYEGYAAIVFKFTGEY